MVQRSRRGLERIGRQPHRCAGDDAERLSCSDAGIYVYLLMDKAIVSSVSDTTGDHVGGARGALARAPHTSILR